MKSFNDFADTIITGNFYSITNESEINSARMFFAQGCEVPSGAVDESAMS